MQGIQGIQGILDPPSVPLLRFKLR